MGQEKNAENIPFLRSTQPKSTERVPVVELSGEYGRTWGKLPGGGFLPQEWLR